MANVRCTNVFKCLVLYFVYNANFTWAEVIENPAIASKCKRMALRRVNGEWESTHLPSECMTDSDEEAARLCKEAFPSLFITGVRPTGSEKLNGPWCKTTHTDWSKPCKGKAHQTMVYECLTRDSSANMRKGIQHENRVLPGAIDGSQYAFQDLETDTRRGDSFEIPIMSPRITTTTTTTLTTKYISPTTTTTTTTVEYVSTIVETEDEIPTGPPALAVPPMCSFRHTQRIENETCKDAAGWRNDAQRTCSDMNFQLHSFAPLSTCSDGDLYLGLQFVCCPKESIDLLPTKEKKDIKNQADGPIAMAIKANENIQVSRVELQSPSVAAAAVAVGAAVILLLTALAVITVRGRQRVRRERRLANQRTPLSPEERHLQRLQSTGYENPTYRFFEQRQ